MTTSVKALAWLILALLPAGAAMAQDASVPALPADGCVAPAAPPPPFVAATLPPKPVAPSCINLQTHISTCSNKVLIAYNNKVDARNDAQDKLIEDSNAAVDALNTWMDSAIAFGNCRSKAHKAAFNAAKNGD